MNRIKEMRKNKGMTLKQLAYQLVKNGHLNHVTPATLTRYENEKREPRLETWRALSDFFNVPVSYLQGDPLKDGETLESLQKRHPKMSAMWNDENTENVDVFNRLFDDDYFNSKSHLFPRELTFDEKSDLGRLMSNVFVMAYGEWLAGNYSLGDDLHGVLIEHERQEAPNWILDNDNLLFNAGSSPEHLEK